MRHPSMAVRARLASLGADVFAEVIRSGREAELSNQFVECIRTLSDAEMVDEWGIAPAMVPFFRDLVPLAEHLA